MYSLPDLLADFPNDEVCLEYIFNHKYQGTKCPKCKKAKGFYSNKNLGAYLCMSCRKYNLYPRKDTIFEESKLGLQKWFFIIFLTANGTQNATEISRMTGIGYVAALKIQGMLMALMAKNIKDKDHLSQWENKVKAIYKSVKEEDMFPYLASFQFRSEAKLEAKKEPFFHLLDLCMNI